MRIKILPSKAKRKITLIINCHYKENILYACLSEQEFSQKWPLMRGLLNQRTNGPVKAHLISWPTVSTKPSFAKSDILKWVKVNSGSSLI